MFDVVVVGGGSAGCALAGRLTEHPGRRVLLLEAGPATPLPDDLRAAAALAATAPDHSFNWAHPVQLRRKQAALVPRGRVLGGSSALNGASWVRATPADCDGWGPGWTYADLLPHYIASETDHDYLDAPGHGHAGPIPVRRPQGLQLHPATQRFLAAADALGFPREPDKNAGGPPGAGLVPSNSEHGMRVDAATAYLWPYLGGRTAGLPLHPALDPDAPAAGRLPATREDTPGPVNLHRANLTVRGDMPVRRVLLAGDRAVGVELRDGTRVHAAEVVLAAGAVGTPHLLLASGIGPADDLHAAGIHVRHDRPGVGQGWSDHPAVFLPFHTELRPQQSVPATTQPERGHAVEARPEHGAHAATSPSAQAALNLDSGADPAGDVEVLLFVAPFVTGGDLHLMCLLQHPDSRGAISLPVPDGPPRIEYRYLRTEHDRRRLRHAIRTGAEVLRAGLGTRTGPGGDVLGNDRTLDGWIATHLTTAVHLCGSAAIGPATDPAAVVDAQLRVHGIHGLRIADTSVLPTAPRRGPAATAVAIGEKAATLLDQG